MNSSLWSADRRTHIKIIAVSFVMTGLILVAVGSSIHATSNSSEAVRNYVDSRPAVAGRPVTFSAASSSTIR